MSKAIDAANKALSQAQAKLAKLTDEQNALNQSIEALQSTRSAAVRTLAGGDESQRRVILDLEGKLAPLLLRVEGLTGLISDAEAEVDAVSEDLKQATDESDKALNEYIQWREKEFIARERATSDSCI